LPDEEVPLHRLGFAAAAREAAGPWFARLREDLLGSPFGFVHGDTSAANVLLAKDRAWLVDFSHAGFGCQLFDLAAFLLTCGLDAPARRVLALDYARRRELPPEETADLTDAAGLRWGIGELLRLPRRQIETLGDEGATEAILTAASRIQRGIRASAGENEAAGAIRRALWPE
jgi:Ser/Thr protein kinase RdoA (MazF antagonist)